MPNTFTKIASVTVGSGGAATIDFTSIPATFTDLCLLTSLRTNRNDGNTEDSVKVEFNGVTAGYTRRSVRGDGANTGSSSASDSLFLLHQDTTFNTANTFSSASTYIPNYAGATNKSLSVDTVNENNTTVAWAVLIAGLWSNTAAITSIKLTPNVGTGFVQHSTATLYGIKNS